LFSPNVTTGVSTPEAFTRGAITRARARAARPRRMAWSDSRRRRRRAPQSCRASSVRADRIRIGSSDHLRISWMNETPSRSGRPRSRMTTSGLRVPASMSPLATVSASMDVPAFRLERGAHEASDVLFVFDHQQHGRGFSFAHDRSPARASRA
jgi:hypothetical protein